MWKWKKTKFSKKEKFKNRNNWSGPIVGGPGTSCPWNIYDRIKQKAKKNFYRKHLNKSSVLKPRKVLKCKKQKKKKLQKKKYICHSEYAKVVCRKCSLSGDMRYDTCNSNIFTSTAIFSANRRIGKTWPISASVIRQK